MFCTLLTFTLAEVTFCMFTRLITVLYSCSGDTLLLPGMTHNVTHVTALYLCESSFLVTVLIHFYNSVWSFGLTLVNGMSLFSDL